MNTKWLIESEAFPEDVAPLFEAAESLGIEYKDFSSKHYWSSEFDEHVQGLFSPEDCVVFYGSLEIAKKLRRCAKWIPGVYYNVEKYNCTSYYPALGKNMLNSNYVMLPYGELRRQKEFLYEKLGSDRAIFVRPNAGDKVFTGKVVYKENFEKDVDLFGFYDVPPEALVVVAEPINIAAEWRFVVVEGQVVTGSLYRKDGRAGSEAGFSYEAQQVVEEVILDYNPDRAWIVDVCMTKSGEYRLVEIGCFSCAGLYLCDRKAIVQAVSAAALKEWEEYQ